MFQEPLSETRPEGDIEGLRWDIRLGEGYANMIDTVAWRHATENLRRVRELMIASLVEGKDGADRYREAIKVIDSFLKLPDWAMKTGKQARAGLQQIGESDV